MGKLGGNDLALGSVKIVCLGICAIVSLNLNSLLLQK